MGRGRIRISHVGTIPVRSRRVSRARRKGPVKHGFPEMEVVMRCPLVALAVLAAALVSAYAQESKYYELPKGDYPHDVAVGPNGEVWYSGQSRRIAGRLNPASGEIERIPLGKNSAPHGVILGPDGAPWFTDGGQNAIVRVDPASKQVKLWSLPRARTSHADLNTAAFDGKGRIWFTGQGGIYGRLDPKTGDMHVWDAQGPRTLR